VNEKLLREVITRILSDPNIQGLLTNVSPEVSPEKPECLVLVQCEDGLAALADIERRYGCDWNIQLCNIGDEIQVDLSLSRISWVHVKAKKTWARVVIPVCSSGQLAQIAMGLSLDKVGELTSWAIKQSIPVEIGQVKDEFTERTPQAYRDLFAGYFEQATAYGVIIGDDHLVTKSAPVLQSALATMSPVVPLSTKNASNRGESDLVPWSFSVDRKIDESIPTQRPRISFTKHLFSVKEAMALPSYTVLQVARGTVLTPSALDTLKSNKVEVIREGMKCR
jgi:hypothetical protein